MNIYIAASGVSFVEAEKSELLYLKVNSDQEAFDLYNDYDFRKGFGVRKGKNRPRSKGQGWSMRKFLCSNAGLKYDGKVITEPRKYEKLDTRTDCKALVKFNIDKSGIYTLVQHEMVHNHELIPPEQTHNLRSQRKVLEEQQQFMSNLKKSGAGVNNSYRVMRNEAGGSPLLGFTKKDAYNALAKQKRKEQKLDGDDCKNLIRLFAKR